MDEVLIATGFTGALTLVFLIRAVYRRFGWLTTIAVYHSPKGGCTEAIVHELKLARREILVQAYSFTSDALTHELVEAKKRGVHVEILLDRSNEAERYSELRVFLEAGLAPLIDAQHAIAHNKIMIIDRRTLVTGSFNFTHQAEKENAENLLIIKGQAELLKSYCHHFAEHKSHCQPAQVKAPAEDKHAARAKAA
jgi:phosphatidylserine/phosphatidylglycerophosphate/cardiolipin synthase-like enzyme